MNLTPWRKHDPATDLERSSDTSIAFQTWVDLMTEAFTFNGNTYTLPGASQEEPTGQFESMAQQMFKTSGVVAACMWVRMFLFAEARFQFRQLQSGRPGKLFGNVTLTPLEHPWPGATTGDLLSKMLMHVDLAGNAYAVRIGDTIRVLRPDWVTIVLGSNATGAAWDATAEVAGYVYQPGGKTSGRPAQVFTADQVAHFAPYPDPQAQFRGMSWLTPIVREVMADKAMTQHKLAFMENGATVNLLVKFDVDSVEKMRPWVEAFTEQHAGAGNAYKTLFTAAGTDATAIGANLEQVEFKVTQGAGETRIAAAAGVPPVIVGLSEGLAAATYSNYGQARRRFSDGTIWPLWRNLCGSMERIIQVPANSELWIDDRDIPFLREDEKDRAVIMAAEATMMRTLSDGGWDPDAIISAVTSGDWNDLVGKHTGLVPVQLHAPGTTPAVPHGGTALPPDQPADQGQNGTRDDIELTTRLLIEATR